jgi:hypothetical protein
MSTILYYSNYCDHSKKLLQTLSKRQSSKNIHFISIDKRVKDDKGVMYIVLENGQKIIMPSNISKVPALLLLNDNYNVLYGNDIYNYFKPEEQIVTQKATMNNMEPMAFSLGGNGGFGIMSDQFSFLDMDSEELNAKGNGGVRQMHNYVNLNHSDVITNSSSDVKNDKLPEGLTIEQLKQQRENEIRSMNMRDEKKDKLKDIKNKMYN